MLKLSFSQFRWQNVYANFLFRKKKYFKKADNRTVQIRLLYNYKINKVFLAEFLNLAMLNDCVATAI